MKKIILMLALFISAVCIGKENPNMEAVWFMCEKHREAKYDPIYERDERTESWKKIGYAYVAGIDPELLKTKSNLEGVGDNFSSIGFNIYCLYEINQYESLSDECIKDAKWHRERIMESVGQIKKDYKKLQRREYEKSLEYQKILREKLNDIEL